MIDPIVIGLDPIALRLGGVPIRWSGLLIALGIVAGLGLAIREAARRQIDRDAIYSCALWSVASGIVGARAFDVLGRIDFYLQNPATIAALRQGGLSGWGAILAGSTAGALYCRIAGRPIGRVADLAAPALLLGVVVGRLGSLVNGDSSGVPIDLPWSTMYIQREALTPTLGEPLHPYPLYEMLWNALALGVVWRIRRAPVAPGTHYLVALLLYAGGRFALGFVRDEPRLALGLQAGQLIALLVLLVVVPLVRRRWQPASAWASG